MDRLDSTDELNEAALRRSGRLRFWRQCSLRFLFLLTTCTACFFAGRLSMAPRLERARSETADARAAIVEARAVADANFRRAQMAVDQMMAQMAMQQTSAATNRATRRALLQSAAETYQGLVDEGAISTMERERLRDAIDAIESESEADEPNSEGRDTSAADSRDGDSSERGASPPAADGIDSSSGVDEGTDDGSSGDPSSR